MVFLPDTHRCLELYFLRHGLAGEHGDPKYKDDSLRPLTAEGQKKMHRAVLGMNALGIEFDAILSSPYVRAQETAEIVAKYGKFKKNKKIHLTGNLLPPATIDLLLKEAQSLFPTSKNILLVGHEPHLSEMISDLLQCDNPLNIDFKKGGLCCLTLETSQAALNWLLTPKQLHALVPDF